MFSYFESLKSHIFLNAIKCGLSVAVFCFCMSGYGRPQNGGDRASWNRMDIPLSEIVYTSADSAQIVSWLSESFTGNDVLHYARKFIDRPYVGKTLECADPEKLIVNLRELDCTTLVETVCALALTKRQKSDKFADYCKNLEFLRYWGGKRDSYCSRLHYFTWWMHDNVHKNIFEEVTDSTVCTSSMVVRNSYMSQFPERYPMLKNHPERVKIILDLERKYNGHDGYYLPEQKAGWGKSRLGFIQDGDVIAIVTKKPGLDYSHLGFAVWGKDGKLHLLNASSLKKKVIEDSMTLRDYLVRQKSALGIRLLRLK